MWKPWTILLLTFLTAGCGQQLVGPQGPQGPAGDVGAQGPQGNNGHSLVSEVVAATALECAVSGQRLDIYLDLDDSLTLSTGDTYQSSLVACNGANGAQGIQGIQGAQGPQGTVGPAGAIGADGPQGVAGPVGPQGIQGPQGTVGAQGATGSGATVQNYAMSSTCVALGDALYAKKSSSAVRIYNVSTCSSASQVAEIVDGTESYWITSNRLGFNTGAGTNLRIVNYN